MGVTIPAGCSLIPGPGSWSLSCLRLDLLAGDLVLDLLGLGDLEDLLLGAALPLGVTELLLDDVGELLVMVLFLSVGFTNGV